MISEFDKQSPRSDPAPAKWCSLIRRDGSLFFRLTIPSLLTVFLLWAGYTAFWVNKHVSDASQTFNENGTRAATLYSGAVAAALWEFDRRSAAATLAGLTDWPGFVSATVSDKAGVFVVHRNDKHPFYVSSPTPGMPRALSSVPPDGSVTFEAEVIHPLYGRLGTLTAVFDQRSVEQAIASARQSTFISAVVGFLFLSVLLTLVASSVTRPLSRITRAVERVAHGELDFKVPDSNSSDEVGRLAKALEVFRRNASHLVEAKAEAEANRRVADLAMIDDLTGLANRRAVTERFAELERGQSTTPEQAYSLVHVDLDGFKQINDTLGHKAGDHVLREVAKRFRKFSDRCDLIARIGGDEFVLLIKQIEGEDTPETVADALIWEVTQRILLDHQHLRVGASVGIAHFDPEDQTLSKTLVNADIALYRAKAQGKGRFVTFDKTHRQEIIARKQTHDEILEGIKNTRFVPYFQGIFDAQSGELAAVEMLARWDHPKRGVRTPADFLEVAQNLNLMRLIDQQVLSQAIVLFKSLASRGVTLPRLCVNVSMTRLVEPDLLDMLEDAVRADIAMDVELLESTFLDEPSDMLLWQLDRIRGLGIGLNIDDFGTGHASVAGLLKIKPNKVKIDRCFVAPILDSSQSLNLVATLNGLCASLDIETVAEGVETPAHAQPLRTLGVRYLQGYGLMRPVPAQQLEDMLIETKTSATG